MMVKPMKITELHYPIYQLLIIFSSYNKSQNDIVFIQDKINYVKASR